MVLPEAGRLRGDHQESGTRQTLTVQQTALFFRATGTIWPINKDDSLVSMCPRTEHVLLSAVILEKRGSEP